MPSLRLSSLRFLLRLPGELEYDYRNFEWPYETINIDYCLEEHCLTFLDYKRSKPLPPKKKYSLLIFTRSALPCRRSVHNHSFTMKLKQKSSTSSIKWTCDHINNFEQIRDTLLNFKTTKELEIITWTGTELQNVCLSQSRACLGKLVYSEIIIVLL
jgi:hypothetical protein